MMIFKNIREFFSKTKTRAILPTFEDEIERQSYFYVLFGSIAYFLGQPTFIFLDMQLIPDEPLIVILRLISAFVALSIFILNFIPFSKRRSTVLLGILFYSLFIGTAVWTALAKGNATYLIGFYFVLMLVLLSPLKLIWNYGVIFLSLAVFFVLGSIKGMDMTTLNFKFAILVLIDEVALLCLFMYLTYFLRRENYNQSKEIQRERNDLSRNYEKVERELALARKIQEMLIPESCTFSGVASLYKPMHLVGGDFFDYVYFRDKNELGIFLSDVSGHGVPAAFITSMIKSYILQARDELKDPASLFRKLNEHLCNHTNNNFITAFYGILNFSTKRFLYANAGHCPPLLIDSSGPRFLKTSVNCFPLAVMSSEEMISINKDYTNNETILGNINKLVLYTDGLTEAASPTLPGQDFESVLLNPDMAELCHTHPSDFIRLVYQRLKAFHGGDRFEDDVCAICIDL